MLPLDFQSVAVNPTKFTHHPIRGGGQNGAPGTCAATGNCACPETDAEGGGIIAAPPSTGAGAVAAVIAAPCGG